MALRDVYLQPDLPDPVLQEDVVLKVVRRHIPDARAVSAVDESGGEARTYVVETEDGEVILKTQRPHRVRARTSLEKEAFMLRHLESAYRAEPLPVPRVHGYGRGGANGELEYICMSRVEGAALQNLTLDRAARRRVLTELGQVLARIHAVPQELLLNSGLLPGDQTAEDLITRIEGGFSAVLAVLRVGSVPWPRETMPDDLVAAARHGLPQNGAVPLVAVHSNPGASHTFADPVTGRFMGLIDFGDAYVSHPAFDLIRWADAEDRDAVLEGYTVVAGEVVDEAFHATWRALSVLVELQSVARQSDNTALATTQSRAMLGR